MWESMLLLLTEGCGAEEGGSWARHRSSSKRQEQNTAEHERKAGVRSENSLPMPCRGGERRRGLKVEKGSYKSTSRSKVRVTGAHKSLKAFAGVREGARDTGHLSHELNTSMVPILVAVIYGHYQRMDRQAPTAQGMLSMLADEGQ